MNLKDTANASAPDLSFQHKAMQDYHSRPTEVSQPSQLAENNDLPPSLPLESHLHAPHSTNTTSTPQTECTFSSTTIDSDADDQLEQHMFSESASLKFVFNLLCHHLQPKNGVPPHPHHRPREGAQPQSCLRIWTWRTPTRIYVKKV
jgi:hypothetical protein